jgi:AcrR family transcriptional regulator
MGRTRTFLIEQVCDVVRDLVLSRGYDAVGIEDIVKATGIGRGSLYQAFGSKALLVAQTVADAANRRDSRRAELAAVLIASSAATDPDVRAALQACLTTIDEPIAPKLGDALLTRFISKE